MRSETSSGFLVKFLFLGGAESYAVTPPGSGELPELSDRVVHMRDDAITIVFRIAPATTMYVSASCELEFSLEVSLRVIRPE